MNWQQATLAIIILSAFPVWAGVNLAVVPVSCVFGEKVDVASAELVCTEMINAVSQTYSNVTFAKQDQNKVPSLVITIHTATDKAAGLMLTWTTQNGQVYQGDRMSVSTADTTLNASKRAALYRRALAANPMPSN